MSLLAACGGDGTDVGAAEAPGPGQAAAPLVVLLRSGGIAGLQDRVAVDALGVVTVTRDRSPGPTTHTLSPTNMAALRTALVRADMAALARNYLDRNAADAYQYDVTYQGVTVTADEGVLPAKLRPVVDLLAKLISP